MQFISKQPRFSMRNHQKKCIYTLISSCLVILQLHWQFQKLHHCVSSSGIESMSSGHVGCSASRTEGRMGKKSWSVITRLRLLRLVLQACTSSTSIASTLDFVEMKRQNHYHQHDHFKLLECTYALHPACYEFTTWTACEKDSSCEFRDVSLDVIRSHQNLGLKCSPKTCRSPAWSSGRMTSLVSLLGGTKHWLHAS